MLCPCYGSSKWFTTTYISKYWTENQWIRYLRVLGGKVIRDAEPTIIQVVNSWIVFNVGRGPTDDKPNVTLHPPQNLEEYSSFMNIRVADIWACYEEWRRKGAEFLRAKKSYLGNPLLHAWPRWLYNRDRTDYWRIERSQDLIKTPTVGIRSRVVVGLMNIVSDYGQGCVNHFWLKLWARNDLVLTSLRPSADLLF